MKDKQKAIENGLIIHNRKEAFCTNLSTILTARLQEFQLWWIVGKIQHTDLILKNKIISALNPF